MLVRRLETKETVFPFLNQRVSIKVSSAFIKNNNMQNTGHKRIVSKAVIFIYSISLLLCLISFKTANAATLDFSALADGYAKGSEISVDINVSSIDQSINAASGVISFPADKLEVTSISKDSSIFTFWVQEPTFSNTLGNVNFEGVIFNPGFIGENGNIMTIKFKVKDSGKASLNLLSGLVLANDGFGTDVFATLGEKLFDLR